MRKGEQVTLKNALSLRSVTSSMLYSIEPGKVGITVTETFWDNDGGAWVIVLFKENLLISPIAELSPMYGTA